MRLKRNMIIRFKDDNGQEVNCIVLPVTKRDLKRWINADHTGLFGFRGLWHKGHPTQIRPYGKIYDITDGYYVLQLIRPDIIGLSKKQLRELLG